MHARVPLHTRSSWPSLTAQPVVWWRCYCESMAIALDDLNLHDSVLMSIAVRGAPDAEVVVELDYIQSYESMARAHACLRFGDVALVELGMTTWITNPDPIRSGRTLDPLMTDEILRSRGLSHVNHESLQAHELETAITASRLVIVCRTMSIEIVG